LMFLKHRERERDYVQREKKKSVFEKNQSTARVPFDIPERERRVHCAEIERETRALAFQTDRERNHFKKKTYRARFALPYPSSSSPERWWWFRDDARCCCCCYSSASRENSSALPLAEFRWSFLSREKQISETDVNALVVRKSAGNVARSRVRERVFFVRPTFRDGSRWCRPEVWLFSPLRGTNKWRIASFGSPPRDLFFFSREFN
jgi:hypothetical protein